MHGAETKKKRASESQPPLCGLFRIGPRVEARKHDEEPRVECHRHPNDPREVASDGRVEVCPHRYGDKGTHKLQDLQCCEVPFPPWRPSSRSQVVVVVHDAMDERVEYHTTSHPVDVAAEPSPARERDDQMVPPC